MTFDEHYFRTNTYQDVSFARFSQYWWSNRFYAILARRYGKRGGRLLEIGSGLGHLAGQLEPVFQTTAVDVNPWALQQSKWTANRTIHVASSAEMLPFQDGWFDIVIIKHVIEHLQNPGQAISEISRISAANGALLLASPNPDSIGRRWKGKEWIGYRDPTHISIKAPREWLELVAGAGFKVISYFSDGLWDAPYIRFFPRKLQKFFFGSLGGLQAILGMPFLPLRWGESIILIARKIGCGEN